jgi:hypothetical protein
MKTTTVYRVTYKASRTARKIHTAIRFGVAAGAIDGAIVLSVEPLSGEVDIETALAIAAAAH